MVTCNPVQPVSGSSRWRLNWHTHLSPYGVWGGGGTGHPGGTKNKIIFKGIGSGEPTMAIQQLHPYPESESRRRFGIFFLCLSGNSCYASDAKLYQPLLLLWIHQLRGDEGVPATWATAGSPYLICPGLCSG